MDVGHCWLHPLTIRWGGVIVSVGIRHSSVGVVIVCGRHGGCCAWALFVVGAGSSLVGTRSPCCGQAGCCSWAAVVVVGAGCSWALGRYSRILGQAVVHGWVGAMLCVMCHG